MMMKLNLLQRTTGWTGVYLLLPVLVGAQNFGWLLGFIAGLMGVVQTAVPLLIALALALFIWGMVVFIVNAADEKLRAEGKKKMVWGIVGLFVIVTIWGLVALLQQVTDIYPNDAGDVKAPQGDFVPYGV
jgi:hypothetical protein